MKTKILTLILTMILLSIASYADLSVNSVTVSNYISEDATGSITIRNLGNTTVSGISVAAQNFDPEFIFQEITAAGTSLGAGLSTTYTFKITVPNKESTIVDTHKIGDLVVSGTNVTSITSQINFEPKPRLQIDNVDITVDGDKEGVSEGENIKVKRGDSIDIEFEVQNQYTRSSNNDITDIDVTIYNDQLDIDDDDQIDVDASEEEVISFSFSIDDDADDGTETVEIRVEGYDDNGVLHVDIFEFDIDVRVESKEVSISNAYFSPSIVTCERTTTLTVEVKNTGLRDLEDTMVMIDVDDSDWDFKTDWIKSIDLDEGDEYTAKFKIVVPEDLPPSDYLFDVESFYGDSTSDDSDSTIVSLQVEDCVVPKTDDMDTDTVVNKPSTEDDNIIVNTGSGIVLPPNANFASSKKSNLFDLSNTQGVILLVLINLIIIGLIIAVTFAIAKRN